MQALLDVILPVFLVIGFGYAAVWRGLFSDAAVDALMRFTQNFAIPCLLFRAIATLDLGQSFNAPLLFTYYGAHTIGFLLGLFGARLLFGRPWPDCVAIGFAMLFSNSVLMGLPITERAYGSEALAPNYAIVALNAPYCFVLGFIAMAFATAQGGGIGGALTSIARSITRNALMIGIGLGFVVNLTGLPLPGVAWDAIDMMAGAGLPAALFGLGGILCRYRPEGDIATIGFICAGALVVVPAAAWAFGAAAGLSTGEFRSAVLTAAMPPGVNAYVFASLYGVAMRVVATSVLTGTALSVLSAWVWLSLLP